jgi:hypothetical protein
LIQLRYIWYIGFRRRREERKWEKEEGEKLVGGGKGERAAESGELKVGEGGKGLDKDALMFVY